MSIATPMTGAEGIVSKIREMEVDRDFLSQESLDVTSRSKVSALPWRGQFTPDLARTLIDAYTKRGDRVLDPFVGSGTTLSQSIEAGLECMGCEINPAAIELSRVFETAGMVIPVRNEKVKALREISNKLTLSDGDELPSLFSDFDDGQSSGPVESFIERVLRLRQEAADPWLSNGLAVSLMMAMGNGRTLEHGNFSRAISQVARLVSDLPCDPVSCEVLAADARRLPIASDHIDFVLTSPPYINVFNYHQNYRPAVELLGYDVLRAAQREIGANRKFRQNRFMTVIQYCLDMMLSIRELARVCRPGASVVIVVGRESKVRGVPLENGVIVGSLAELSGSLEVIRWQERSFMTRFGEKIFEEILTFRVSDALPLSEDVALKLACETGCLLLTKALTGVDIARHIAVEIESAIGTASAIRPSIFEGHERSKAR